MQKRLEEGQYRTRNGEHSTGSEACPGPPPGASQIARKKVREASAGRAARLCMGVHGLCAER
jgi:hypothetical protein